MNTGREAPSGAQSPTGRVPSRAFRINDTRFDAPSPPPLGRRGRRKVRIGPESGLREREFRLNL